jgi:hypothetical protein
MPAPLARSAPGPAWMTGPGRLSPDHGLGGPVVEQKGMHVGSVIGVVGWCPHRRSCE